MDNKRVYERPTNSKVDKKDLPILKPSPIFTSTRKVEPVGEPKEPVENMEPKKENPEYNRIARNLFLFLGFIVALFAVWLIVSYNQTRFEYEGVDFQRVKEIAPYRTGIPVTVSDSKITGGVIQNTNYYFYLRNDPRALKDIPFNGDIVIKKDLVMRSDASFNCNGEGLIGVANLAKLYEIIGTKVMVDKNATCDESGRYMFISMEEGNKTEIEKYGPSCYRMKISNCEVLKATEKFMIKTFAEIKNQSA